MRRLVDQPKLRTASLISVAMVTDAQPSESETAVWDKVNEVLTEAQVVLEELQTYRGAGEEIRQVNLQLLTRAEGAALIEPLRVFNLIRRSKFRGSRFIHVSGFYFERTCLLCVFRPSRTRLQTWSRRRPGPLWSLWSLNSRPSTSSLRNWVRRGPGPYLVPGETWTWSPTASAGRSLKRHVPLCPSVSLRVQPALSPQRPHQLQLHSDPTPGVPAGAGPTVRPHPALHAALRRAEGRLLFASSLAPPPLSALLFGSSLSFCVPRWLLLLISTLFFSSSSSLCAPLWLLLLSLCSSLAPPPLSAPVWLLLSTLFFSCSSSSYALL